MLVARPKLFLKLCASGIEAELQNISLGKSFMLILKVYIAIGVCCQSKLDTVTKGTKCFSTRDSTASKLWVTKSLSSLGLGV